MIVRIEELERSSRTIKTKKGEMDQPGLMVRGIKFDDQGEDKGPYEKFLSDYFDGEFISVLEKIGVGGMARMNFVKDGKFWKLVDVIPMDEDQAPAPSREPAPRQEIPTQTSVVPKSVPNAVMAVDTARYTRDDALMSAIELLKIHGAGKMSPELLCQQAINMAKEIAGYLENVPAEKLVSSAADVKTGAEESVPGGDDKIPF